MNEDQNRQSNLIDTTDCLEAVGVFRFWKNALFIIIILLLLLLQVSFWLVNAGYVKTDEGPKSEMAAVAAEDVEKTEQASKTPEQATQKTNEIEKAAKQVTAEPNQPVKAVPQQPQKTSPRFQFVITFGKLALLIRFFNFSLILTTLLYCLTMLFSLKISLLGRLGGINHITRAFFISLFFIVFLLPWQKFFPGVVAGAMFTPSELLRCTGCCNCGMFCSIFYYLRFVGYWLLVMLLLICSQLRSIRWSKAILRRLEVI